MNKEMYIYILEFYLATKINDVTAFVEKCIKLEFAVLGNISQTKKKYTTFLIYRKLDLNLIYIHTYMHIVHL